MKLSALTIKSLSDVLIGNIGAFPRLSGSQIISLFNLVGFRDIYNGGMPGQVARKQYAFESLMKINGTKEMKQLLEIVVDRRHLMNIPDVDVTTIIEELNTLITPDHFRYEKAGDRYIIIGAELPDEVEVEAHFEQIKAQIIEQIQAARFMIWIAVAWFTDKDLMNELYKKKKEGVNVRIVISDDETNGKVSPSLETYFETKRIKPTGAYANLMHHKFCIVDLRTVIHGSYNWTVKAQFNKENIAIEYGRKIAEKYAQQFVELIK